MHLLWQSDFWSSGLHSVPGMHTQIFLLSLEVVILCECIKNWDLSKCSLAGTAILTPKAVADLELTQMNLCCQ